MQTDQSPDPRVGPRFSSVHARRDGAPDGAALAAKRFLSLFKGRFRILKAVEFDGRRVAMMVQRGDRLGLLLLHRAEDGVWKLDDEATGVWDSAPEPGSRQFPLTVVGAGPYTVLGGLVDPETSRLVSEDPHGDVIDVDHPSGATAIVVGYPWTVVTADDGVGPLFITPITSVSRVGTASARSPSTGFAEGFLQALRRGDFEQAQRALDTEVPPRSFLPPLIRLVARLEDIGNGRRDGGAVWFPARLSDQKVRLYIRLLQDGNAFRAWSYGLARDDANR